MARWANWLDERTGFRAWWATRRAAPIAGGARWGHALGASLGALFLLEAVTGIGLAAYYSPSTASAWASVNYLQNSVALGWVLRGLHHFGAHAFVVVLILHFLQTLWTASFRAPRELNWLIGLALANVVLVSSHTGILLPGDQRAYFATQIMFGIAESVPLIGRPAAELLKGGPELGNLTLTHLYAIHTLVLPGVFVALMAAHGALVRRQGRTPSPRLTHVEVQARTEPFSPGQRDRNLALGGLTLLIVFGVVMWRHGVALDSPADPSQQYPGRPEWYFYSLFELRKRMEGSLEWVATVIVPGIAMTCLALLPYFDQRLRARGHDSRRVLGGAVTLALVATAALGILPAVRDIRDPTFRKMRLEADGEAALAQRLAVAGVPTQGPTFLFRNDPVLWGARVYVEKCANCHPVACDKKPYKGALCLHRYASRAWLLDFLNSPKDPLFFGNTKIDDMDPWSGSTDRLQALAEFLYSQADRPDVDKALAETGRKVYEKEGCDSCHSLDGKGSGLAPDLKVYAGAEWLAAFIRTPGGPRFYGEKNEMDAFDAAKMSEPELHAVVAFLRAAASAPPAP
jgi:ubiquinol-cytochrome c reductase cytochrome b subunit